MVTTAVTCMKVMSGPWSDSNGTNNLGKYSRVFELIKDPGRSFVWILETFCLKLGLSLSCESHLTTKRPLKEVCGFIAVFQGRGFLLDIKGTKCSQWFVCKCIYVTPFIGRYRFIYTYTSTYMFQLIWVCIVDIHLVKTICNAGYKKCFLWSWSCCKQYLKTSATCNVWTCNVCWPDRRGKVLLPTSPVYFRTIPPPQQRTLGTCNR